MPALTIGGNGLTDSYDEILAGPFDSGREVVLNKRTTKLRDISVLYTKDCFNNYSALEDFFDRMLGRYGYFSFEMPYGSGFAPSDTRSLKWKKVYIGVTDGATVNYDLPAIDLDTSDADHFSLFGNRILIDPVDYTISDNALATPTDFTTWISTGTAPSAITPGQADPNAGTAASLIAYVGAAPAALHVVSTPVLAGDEIVADVYLRAATGTLPITVWAQDSGGDSVATVVTLTTAWQLISARCLALVAANKQMQIGFTGGQTPGNYYAYKARIAPGRDGRQRLTLGAAGAAGVTLEADLRGTPVIFARLGSSAFNRNPQFGYVISVTQEFKEVRL